MGLLLFTITVQTLLSKGYAQKEAQLATVASYNNLKSNLHLKEPVELVLAISLGS